MKKLANMAIMIASIEGCRAIDAVRDAEDQARWRRKIEVFDGKWNRKLNKQVARSAEMHERFARGLPPWDDTPIKSKSSPTAREYKTDVQVGGARGRTFTPPYSDAVTWQPVPARSTDAAPGASPTYFRLAADSTDRQTEAAGVTAKSARVVPPLRLGGHEYELSSIGRPREWLIGVRSTADSTAPISAGRLSPVGRLSSGIRSRRRTFSPPYPSAIAWQPIPTRTADAAPGASATHFSLAADSAGRRARTDGVPARNGLSFLGRPREWPLGNRPTAASAALTGASLPSPAGHLSSGIGSRRRTSSLSCSGVPVWQPAPARTTDAAPGAGAAHFRLAAGSTDRRARAGGVPARNGLSFLDRPREWPLGNRPTAASAALTGASLPSPAGHLSSGIESRRRTSSPSYLGVPVWQSAPARTTDAAPGASAAYLRLAAVSTVQQARTAGAPTRSAHAVSGLPSPATGAQTKEGHKTMFAAARHRSPSPSGRAPLSPEQQTEHALRKEMYIEFYGDGPDRLSESFVETPGARQRAIARLSQKTRSRARSASPGRQDNHTRKIAANLSKAMSD